MVMHFPSLCIQSRRLRRRGVGEEDEKMKFWSANVAIEIYKSQDTRDVMAHSLPSRMLRTCTCTRCIHLQQALRAHVVRVCARVCVPADILLAKSRIYIFWQQETTM